MVVNVNIPELVSRLLLLFRTRSRTLILAETVLIHCPDGHHDITVVGSQFVDRMGERGALGDAVESVDHANRSGR